MNFHHPHQSRDPSRLNLLLPFLLVLASHSAPIHTDAVGTFVAPRLQAYHGIGGRLGDAGLGSQPDVRETPSVKDNARSASIESLDVPACSMIPAMPHSIFVFMFSSSLSVLSNDEMA